VDLGKRHLACARTIARKTLLKTSQRRIHIDTVILVIILYQMMLRLVPETWNGLICPTFLPTNDTFHDWTFHTTLYT
jgi:hypothetical protein